MTQELESLAEDWREMARALEGKIVAMENDYTPYDEYWVQKYRVRADTLREAATALERVIKE